MQKAFCDASRHHGINGIQHAPVARNAASPDRAEMMVSPVLNSWKPDMTSRSTSRMYSGRWHKADFVESGQALREGRRA